MLGTPLEQTLRTGELPARHSAMAVSAALDSAMCCIPLIIAVAIGIAGSLNSTRVVLAGVAVSLAAMLALTCVRARTGSSAGHALFGLRTIAATTGLPAWPFLTPGSRVTLDSRNGVDPLHLKPRASAQNGHSPPVEIPRRRQAHLQLHLDDGSALPIPGVVAVGRDARALGTIPRIPSLAIMDFNRTLDAIHAIIEPMPNGIRLHAVSRRHPTHCAVEGRVQRVEPGHAVEVALAVPFWLGDRRFAVHEIIPTRRGWAVAR